MKPPPVIRDLRVVRRKAEMLEELGYIEVATKVLWPLRLSASF